MARSLVFICVSICAILILVEVVSRAAGFGSFPVYDLDKNMKYIPAANQQGYFLNRNTWFFNNRHMGNAEDWTAVKHPNVLLVGNSIVLGGDPYKHEEKLGPLLEKALGDPYIVWSAAAGAWSELNEMAYLEQNSDVLKNADVVILEYMPGGLSSITAWPGYYVFPDHKPLILTSYLFEKYVMRGLLGKRATEAGPLPPSGETNEVHLRRFKALVSSIAASHKLVIFLYPTRAELEDKEKRLAAFSPVQGVCEERRLMCVDLSIEKAWTVESYKPDGVHPTPAANAILATILADALK